MSKKGATQIKQLREQGYHVLIIKDPAQTTIQPLTDEGLKAIQSILLDDGAPGDVVDAMAQKRHGEYTAMIQTDMSPQAIVRACVRDHGLSDRSIAFQDSGVEITPLGLNDSIH